MKQLVELPARWRIDCPVRRIARPLSSLDEAIAAALARPISSLPLDMICRPGNRVTLVCADPNYEPDELNRAFVPALLRELKSAGVYDEDITILSATGLRRPSSPTEIHARLGDEVAQHYPIFSHNAHDAREQDDLGVYEHVPVRVNYHAVEADVLIATGIVQPHLYAGYTGGSKIVAVGCADAATIHELYSPRFLDDPSVRAGNIEGNACQRAIREIGHRAGLTFVLNAVVDPGGNVVAVAAGAPNAVHNRLAAFARTVYEVETPREAYNVIISPAAESGRDLYHATCDSAFITAAREGVLMKGGVLVLPVTETTDGAHSVEQQRFHDVLTDGGDMDGVLRQLRRRGIRGGEDCAYTLARGVVEQGYRIIIVGSDRQTITEHSGLITARDMAEAVELAESLVGSRPYALVMPQGRRLMPAYSGIRSTLSTTVDGSGQVRDTELLPQWLEYNDPGPERLISPLLPESGLYSEN